MANCRKIEAEEEKKGTEHFPLCQLVVAGIQRLDGLGIGRTDLNALPWRSLRDDMKHFRSVIRAKNKRCAVIMGRKTWESIPRRFRPLRGCTNFVVTSDSSLAREAHVIHNCDAFIKTKRLFDFDIVSILGGVSVYEAFLPLVSTLHVTLVRCFEPTDVVLKCAFAEDSQELTISKRKFVRITRCTCTSPIVYHDGRKRNADISFCVFKSKK